MAVTLSGEANLHLAMCRILRSYDMEGCLCRRIGIVFYLQCEICLYGITKNRLHFRKWGFLFRIEYHGTSISHLITSGIDETECLVFLCVYRYSSERQSHGNC